MKRTLVSIMVLLLALCVFAKGNTEKSSQVEDVKTVLTTNIASDPGRIGMRLGNDDASKIGFNIYSSLILMDHGKYIPDAAESWEFIDDKTVRFYLRDDVNFTDGHKLVAEDVIWYLHWMEQENSTTAQITMFDYSKCRAIDNRTVEMVAKKADPLLLFECSEYFLTYEGAVATNPIYPVGSGAYKVKEWIPGGSVTIEANDDYFGNRPKIRTIVYKVVSESAQLVNSILSGDLDLVSNFPTTDYNYIKEVSGIKTEQTGAYASQCIWFNCTPHSVLSNETARKAICYAVDNQAILNTAFDGIGLVTTAPVSSGLLDYDANWVPEYYQYNKEKAKELFDSCGIDWSKQVINIYTDGSVQFNMMAQIIQGELEEYGITAKIVNFEKASYSAVCKDTNAGWDIFLKRTNCGSGYAWDLISTFLATSRLGYTGWNNAEFDALVKQIETCTAEELPILTGRMIKLVADICPMYAVVNASYLHAMVDNLNTTEHWKRYNSAQGFEWMDRLFFD